MKEKINRANARYSALVESLLQELSALDNERLNRKPTDGGWSGMQTLYHLILVEENAMAYVRKKLSFNPTFKKVGLNAWLRSLLLRISLRSPIKFKAPKSAGAELITDSATLTEARDRWQKIRLEWQDFFEKMPPELMDKAAFNHPLRRTNRLAANA